MSSKHYYITLTEAEIAELRNCIHNSFQDEGEADALCNGNRKEKAALYRAVDKIEKAKPGEKK